MDGYRKDGQPDYTNDIMTVTAYCWQLRHNNVMNLHKQWHLSEIMPGEASAACAQANSAFHPSGVSK